MYVLNILEGNRIKVNNMKVKCFILNEEMGKPYNLIFINPNESLKKTQVVEL